MVLCTTCREAQVVCIFVGDATACESCQRRHIDCSGRFDKEECNRLTLMMQRHNYFYIQSFRQWQRLVDKYDDMVNHAKDLVDDGGSVARCDEFLLAVEAHEANMAAAEAEMENHCRIAATAQKQRDLMIEHAKTLLETLRSNEESDESEGEHEGDDEDEDEDEDDNQIEADNDS